MWMLSTIWVQEALWWSIELQWSNHPGISSNISVHQGFSVQIKLHQTEIRVCHGFGSPIVISLICSPDTLRRQVCRRQAGRLYQVTLSPKKESLTEVVNKPMPAGSPFKSSNKHKIIFYSQEQRFTPLNYNITLSLRFLPQTSILCIILNR
jgi:hypothetical protein